MSNKDNDQMGRDAVFFGLLFILALGTHVYALYKVPRIYWRISRYFWYFFAGYIFLALFNELLDKLDWFYSIQSFLSNGPYLMLPTFIWFCVIPYFVLRAKTQSDWESWPAFTDYCRLHDADSAVMASMNCHSCASPVIKNIGFTNWADSRRLHICNRCSTTLYRSLQG